MPVSRTRSGYTPSPFFLSCLFPQPAPPLSLLLRTTALTWVEYRAVTQCPSTANGFGFCRHNGQGSTTADCYDVSRYA